MAIKARDQVKWTDGATSLELQADTGEAFLIKNIYSTAASGAYLSLSIDKTTVGYLRVSGSGVGNHLHFPLTDDPKNTILGYLWDKGIFKGYPVAEGQSFTIVTSSSLRLCIVYDIYEAGDISPDMENGSEAGTYMLINYGRKSASGNLADGDNSYEYSVLPAEFPEFPFGRDVPAKTAIEIYGIIASDIGRTSNSAANKQETKYIKLIKEREVLFDEDKKGIPLIGSAPSGDAINIGVGWSLVGNYSHIDTRLPLMFSNPLRFESGEELSVIVNTKVLAGSNNISVDYGEIAFVEKVIRTG